MRDKKLTIAAAITAATSEGWMHEADKTWQGTEQEFASFVRPDDGFTIEVQCLDGEPMHLQARGGDGTWCGRCDVRSTRKLQAIFAS